MTLRPGCRLVVAPAFYLTVDWSGRLLLGSGCERVGDDLLPRAGWRPPDDRERAMLVADSPPPVARADAENCLCLFRLPEHLLQIWWQLGEQMGEGDAQEGFNGFTAQVAQFLAFKDIPVPGGTAFDLLVSRPGQGCLGLHGPTPGMTFPLATETLSGPEEARRRGLWGVINLGDEATSLVFLNLPAREILGDQFLTPCPEYPPVRFRVEPGEGVRFPVGGLLVGGCTLDKREPDVLLLLRHGQPGPARGATTGEPGA